MAKFKRIAKKLGLEDLGGDVPSRDKTCRDCGKGLRLGKNPKNNYLESYCPKCKKIVCTIAVPRFPSPIRIVPHDD
jgi:phage FluMu protein Com